MATMKRRVFLDSTLGLDGAGRLINQPDRFAAPQPAGRLHFVNMVPSGAIANSASELAFDVTTVIPGKTLQPGMLVRVRFQGIVTNVAATDTLALRLRLGGLTGVTLLSSAAAAPIANHIFAGEFEGVLRAVGAAGSIVGVGSVARGASGAAAANGANLGATAIDTTIDQTLVVTAQWSAAAAANSCRLDFMRVELW